MSSKKEKLETALKLWGQECEGIGWNSARNVYRGPGRGYKDGFEDGRVRGAKDMQNALEKDLSKRELKGYRLGYDLGQTDGFNSGKERGIWEAQKAIESLTQQLTRAVASGKQSYDRGKKIGYDTGHADGYTKGRATMKTQIEDMLMDEIT